MRRYAMRVFILAVTTATFAGVANAQRLDPAVQAKIDARLQSIKSLAADPTLIAAVKAINSEAPSEYATMTEEKWAQLSILDPLVKHFTSNDVASVLKAKKGDEISEAFVSAADGTKVAFLSKTTNFCHKGKAKHDAPMTGKTWQGPVEVDKSTGVQQVQVAVPVVDNGEPIGSLVVGFAVAKMR